MSSTSAADVRRVAAEALIRDHAKLKWTPEPHQVPPEGDWRGWLMLAGRGSGKTDAMAKYVVDHVNGPACIPGPTPHWVGIIAPTLGDAATACYEGPSGIRAHDASAKMKQAPGGLVIQWPNGSQAKLFGAHTKEDVERLRAGGNRCLTWGDELAAWRNLDNAWDHMQFGLRLGRLPRWVVSTTPKPRLLIVDLVRQRRSNVIVSQNISTYDNPHLHEAVRQEYEDRYGGTSLGQQELLGQILEQDEDALWQRHWLDRDRVKHAPDNLVRIGVGVDPSGGAGEQGIVVVGKQLVKVENRQEIHGFVLADRSGRWSPAEWGRRAVRAAIDFGADVILVETNFGGDMAMATIQGQAENEGVSVPVRKLTASRGKRVRAEPVAALSERGRWHHVGIFDRLEEQLATWTPEAGYSPDRLDAMVWPAWDLRMVGRASAPGSMASSKLMSRKIG